MGANRLRGFHSNSIYPAGFQPIGYLFQILREAAECSVAFTVTIFGNTDLHFRGCDVNAGCTGVDNLQYLASGCLFNFRFLWHIIMIRRMQVRGRITTGILLYGIYGPIIILRTAKPDF